MKSVLIEDSNNIFTEYPILRKYASGRFVVLFTSFRKGTVVYDPDQIYGVGYHCDEWAESSFREFKDKIELSN